ncbi:hypothetical protein BTO09_07885 [Gilvibacter sp. SZ-19]|uniref:heme NO-binding domain-containing protein n=1 Tax=unclassified Gilvibacter TaxID=2625242 RepID=UPI000B3C3D62|nr:heme NO-binding domain-containing protein [Gilvibacter sp. SZ-19]ARV12272.1 hypothetical protein BTO09_07885 [Gilvibacter sp. SZ-19]
MKGIVFTELMELVEEKFGLETVDYIIDQSDLPSGGVYTAVGTYDFGEMLQLLTHLSAKTGIDVGTLQRVFAEHFFQVIKREYPSFLQLYKDPIEMLASIENHIHVEVRKIYPDAQLPTFDIQERSANHLVMVYSSSRSMYNFGLGLMEQTFKHFDKEATITMDMLKEDGSEVKFVISSNG